MSNAVGKLAFMLVGMMANSKTEEELIDEAIESLTEYKLLGCPKENKPMMQVHTLLVKWTGQDLSPESLSQKVDEMDMMLNFRDKMIKPDN